MSKGIIEMFNKSPSGDASKRVKKSVVYYYLLKSKCICKYKPVWANYVYILFKHIPFQENMEENMYILPNRIKCLSLFMTGTE